METKETIFKEIESLPKPLIPEVLNFVRFLKSKNIKEQLSTPILSETSLKKDWSRPEEDEAWQNL